MIVCVTCGVCAHFPIMSAHPRANMLSFGDQTVANCERPPSAQMSCDYSFKSNHASIGFPDVRASSGSGCPYQPPEGIVSNRSAD